MSISRARLIVRLDQVGFTALELLVGMALTVLLALGVAPLLISLQAAEVREADRTVTVLQGRVAAARLERDLRMASAADALFAVDGPIIEAGPRQVVFIGRTGGNLGLALIEWEIADSTLMRRWGPCPKLRPSVFAHSLYLDHKSMMVGLAGNTRFSYEVDGAPLAETVAARDLANVRRVSLYGSGRDMYGEWPKAIFVKARVGL